MQSLEKKMHHNYNDGCISTGFVFKKKIEFLINQDVILLVKIIEIRNFRNL